MGAGCSRSKISVWDPAIFHHEYNIYVYGCLGADIEKKHKTFRKRKKYINLSTRAKNAHISLQILVNKGKLVLPL